MFEFSQLIFQKRAEADCLKRLSSLDSDFLQHCKKKSKKKKKVDNLKS